MPSVKAVEQSRLQSLRIRARSVKAVGRVTTPVNLKGAPSASLHRRLGPISVKAPRRADADAEQSSRIAARLNGALTQHEVMLCDATGSVMYASPSLCRVLGYSPEQVLRRPLQEFVADFESPESSRRTGAKWRHMELIQANGRRMVLPAAIHPIDEGRGTSKGCLLIVRDVAVRAQAEQALVRLESDLRLLSAQLLSAQEVERRRIARELHDGIGQELSALKYRLENIAERVGEDSVANVASSLREAMANASSILEEVRRVAMNLRPATLDDLGVLPTIAWFCREFREVHPKIHVDVLVDIAEHEIAEPVKTVIYRVVQEAFSNIARHAGTAHVSLVLARCEGLVHLRVSDDGAGFDPSRFARPGRDARGIGIASIRHRVESTGGRYRLESTQGKGTTISAYWPLCVDEHSPAT